MCVCVCVHVCVILKRSPEKGRRASLERERRSGESVNQRASVSVCTCMCVHVCACVYVHVCVCVCVIGEEDDSKTEEKRGILKREREDRKTRKCVICKGTSVNGGQWARVGAEKERSGRSGVWDV